MAETQTGKFFAEHCRPLGWTGEMVCPRCEKRQVFLNPTDERREWYERSHRCEGRGWQGQP